MTWPEEIGPKAEHDGNLLKGTTRFKLVHSQGDAYAFYFRKLEFGFGRAIELQVRASKDDPKKRLVGVKWLSGNPFGVTPDGKPRSPANPFTMNWQPTQSAFFPTRRIALGYIEIKVVRINKKSTKPIRPLTVEQIKEWMEGGPKALIRVPGTRRKYAFKPQDQYYATGISVGGPPGIRPWRIHFPPGALTPRFESCGVRILSVATSRESRLKTFESAGN